MFFDIERSFALRIVSRMLKFNNPSAAIDSFFNYSIQNEVAAAKLIATLDS